MTEAEKLFEELCDNSGWQWRRISVSEDEGEKRPDYEIRLQSERFMVVEVKQFDPNPAERAVLEQKVRVFRTEPGDRIRKAVRSGAGQLKTLSEGRRPALLVVYDNVGVRMHTHSYAVLTAMRGLDVVPVLVPSDPAKPPVFQDQRSGPKKKLTKKAHTSISAIAVLCVTESGAELVVYHNPHAKVPLGANELAGANVHHLRMCQDESGWEGVPP